jgi:L-threonylcarbamoyladenylate synthase
MTPLASPSAHQLRLAARLVCGGGVIAYPTEAVFGLGCNPRDAAAVSRLLAIKGRAPTKGLILIAATLEQLLPFTAPLPPQRASEIRAGWPSPTTWVVPARPGVPSWLSGGRSTVAVRVTAHPAAAALCLACRSALISTSANRSGAPPARTGLAVRRSLRDSIDYLLPGRCGPGRRPSRIVDALSGTILRP